MSEAIVQGNAIQLLAELQSGFADCIVTDPPYGDTECAWDTRVAGWADLCLRPLKETGSMWVFGSFRYFTECWSEFSGWTYAQEIIWEKHNGSNAFADRFRRVHELAVQFYPVGRKWGEIYKSPVTTPDATRRTARRKQKAQHWSKIGGHVYRSVDGGPRLMTSVIFARSEHGRAEHPTQKPVDLLEHLVEYSCPRGGMVLDPFSGSGSTGVAALRGGRLFHGFELRADYAAIAERRIANAGGLQLAVVS